MRIAPHLLVIAAVAAAPLARVQAQPHPDGEIVVTGETRKEAQRQAQAYVKQIGVAVGNTQAARWVSPVCPRAIGLSAAHAALVEQRVRKNAKHAGAPLAPAQCEANLVIAFTDNAKAVVKKVTDRDSSPTCKISPSAARELKLGEAPIRWWYNTDTQSRDSVSASGVMPTAAEFVDKHGNRAEPPVNDRSTVLAQYNSSLGSTLALRAIQFATVVVDVDRASGTSLASIIDYASLVGLAEVRLGAAPGDSILSLFRSDAGQSTLSHRDKAFLKGLYRITMDRRAEQQQRTLVGQMVKQAAAN